VSGESFEHQRLTDAQRSEMFYAAKPLIWWMEDNCFPHSCVCVTQRDAVLVDEIFASDVANDSAQTDADWPELFPSEACRQLQAKVERIERENAALRDARSVAEQVCADAFAKVFADYAAKTLTKDTQP
jgi:hypothetical protein